ncbi:Asp-tRNA(Asn)/Glu-tRNA(Gln) amidotransferase subunit GatB [uncultured Imperialibacter sp.]|mgnify:CR=1 FL=1|uniref:Asp-tRNA(Asn)/Glu-tRNA(Gln) amidotransferase subunit GatB n=1 Tax=uncultured Imperialibacter sp. TaxID=1672639 RepID=UPI0030D712B6|tara:strand:+ start:121 stop:1575 length:1455 start_codon:yes stop_codon:yes gene_type:complete
MSDLKDKNSFEAVIGLEVHVQLQTKSKVFSPDANKFGSEPNQHIHVISLGHPGSMPKLNKKALEYAIEMGLACHSEIGRYNFFDRKNYFYPDLPKGYQVTQDKTPICKGGYVEIGFDTNTPKKIMLHKIHMEEDAGKLMHVDGKDISAVDYNRAGVPLIEIVTDPMITSSQDAGAFLTEIRKMVRFLGISDGHMEEGSLRCDANVSIRKKGVTTLGNKVEVKNLNSIRYVQKAIEVEIERQTNLTLQGKAIISETRLFDPEKNQTYGMRMKEELNDYRYFPEPDLAPFVVDDTMLEDIRKKMAKLPRQYYDDFTQKYGLPSYDALVITEKRDFAHLFEEAIAHTTCYKQVSNWLMGPIKSYLKENGTSLRKLSLTGAMLADLVNLVEKGTVSYTVACQNIFPEVIKTGKAPHDIAHDMNLVQESDSDVLMPVIQEVLAQNADKVVMYKNGKKGLLGMFMGEVMKKTNGKADPKLTNQLLVESLA